MEARNTNSGFSLTGRIERKTHDVSDLREAYPDWDEMDAEERMEAARTVEPVDEETVFNVTTDQLHEYFVDNLDLNQTSAEDNVAATWLALGTGGGTTPTTSDTDLTTRTFEKQITDATDNGKDLLTSTFLDSTEGNGNDFDELGLFSGDPDVSSAEIFLLNHATFATVSKNNTKTVTFDVTLTFSDT